VSARLPGDLPAAALKKFNVEYIRIALRSEEENFLSRRASIESIV
jgi:hypothetical protein